MNYTTRKRLTLALGFSLVAIPFLGSAAGQSAGDRAGTGTTAGTNTARDDREGSGFNPGWLGLIGLAGLVGFMPKKVSAVASHRTGDKPGR